ncbi:uncharacterized protein LOC119497756 isoform X2 [Sebastes umbrosus]|uniref:uncharacterized protein LOC119497756 isoform X2 n=1 Tax=Sebastes umbrosus TaxID=72105 RepID=UPI00189C6DD7|nr:uncharacterized protein LOC119497756 isoform X2 [Sebastes umbrosus]
MAEGRWTAARPSAGSSGVATMAEGGYTEKQHHSLIQRVKTMASVIELLLETMKDLSDKELRRFKDALRQTYFAKRYIPRWQLDMKDMQDTVFLMVLTDGQRSVEKTKEVIKTMKRTDLVQRLSDSSSGPKKKHSVDEHLSALIHKVATMRAVKELLLETLNDLSSEELTQFRWLLQFTFFQRNLPLTSWSKLLESTWADLVEMMVGMMMEMYGHQSVEVTEEIFMDMNRTDLVQRLSEISSGPKEKHCVDEHWPALTQEVETMASVIELLLETLKDLSVKERWMFKEVLSETDFARRCIPWLQPTMKDMQDVVFLMVLTDGQRSVENTKEILKTMKRTDLVQRLSDSSSGPTKKHSDEHRPALIQKVATIAAVRYLLLETLKHLSYEEIWKFNEFLQSIVSQKNLPDISLMFSFTSDRAETVDQLVQTYGQQSVELTREVLQKMNKTDLMQRLSKPSSGLKEKQSVDEHQPAVSERHDYRKTGRIFIKLGKLSWYGPKTQEKALSAEVVTTPSALTEVTEAVKQIVLKTLKDLSNKELRKFKQLLQFTSFKKSLPYIPLDVLYFADRADELVDLMVKTCGQQSVEVTREVLMDMNRTDLVERSSETSSGLKEKHPSKRIQKEGTMTPVQEKLLETLKDLNDGELEKFKHVLQYTKMEKSLPIIPRRRMEMADRVGIGKLMVETYGQQSVEVTREVFKKMNRRDLVERLSDISSGSKGPSRSLEPEAGGSVMRDSSDWTKLEPEVNSPDADESLTYSLQSDAGNFECGVSGLRWVCKQKVSFKYQFCSWEEPMERMESIKYMAAGPLIDIKVIAGKLDEVYLPHWICIHDNPTLLDRFAVLHIDDCGDVVEKVSEVTSSHVKLSEPVFSPRAVLMKFGLPVKINCNVLIYYKPNTPYLILHVYLIPRDPALQQTMDKKKGAFKIIKKPRPDKYLKMQQGFNLTADIDTAAIIPEKITLRYDSQDPNFYEVYIENPDRNFHLTLSHLYKRKGEQQREPVWNCEIRKADFQNSGESEAAESTGPCDSATVRVKKTGGQSSIPGSSDKKHSVEEHLSELMQKEATITTDRGRLLKMLENLKQEEFEGFKWNLQDKHLLAGLPCIPCHLLEKSDRFDLVNLMLQTYSQQSVEVTKKVFKEIYRNDLVQELSDTSSGSKAAGSSA